MLRKLKNNQSGFSIVEVMIVLAIAGLIILVVFLAVPALNRNSRNSATRQTVSSIAGLVGESRSANQGKNIATIAIANGTATVTTAAGTPVTATVDASFTKAAAGNAAPAAPGTLNYSIGNKCTGVGAGIKASARSVALLYLLETANGTAPQCLDA